jgi:hypothetical protein
MLVAAAAAGGLALSGLLTAGAASASTSPGTSGAGSWFFDPGTGTNAIQLAKTTTSTSTSTVYKAQVQQPINADGSSVWSANKGVIPVQFTLQQATDTKTTTTTTDAVYPGLLDSEPGGSPAYGALSFTPPAGTTVGNIANLTAAFSWLAGNNHTGSLRWSIVTPDGNVYVYYGDLSSTFQSGQGGSGVNMATVTDARVEGDGSLGGTPLYDTWSDVLSRSAPSGTVANEPVSEIDLVVDAGYAGAQRVQLSDVQITANGSASEYVPGTVPGSTHTTDSIGSYSPTTTPPMYVDVVQTSGGAPGTVDETTYTGVGDTSGQFAVVDGKYKYNLSNASLPGAGTYQVSMDPSSAHNSPITTSPGTFVLK